EKLLPHFKSLAQQSSESLQVEDRILLSKAAVNLGFTTYPNLHNVLSANDNVISGMISKKTSLEQYKLYKQWGRRPDENIAIPPKQRPELLTSGLMGLQLIAEYSKLTVQDIEQFLNHANNLNYLNVDDFAIDGNVLVDFAKYILENNSLLEKYKV